MYKNSRLYAVVAYITWIGFFVSLLMRDKEDPLVRRHLNQALVLNVISLICNILSRLGDSIALICSYISIAIFVLLIWGMIRAIKMNEKPMPLIGAIELIK